MNINSLCAKIITLTLTLTLVLGLLSGCSLQVQPVRSYTSPEGLYSLQYPLEWEARKGTGDTGMLGVTLGSGAALNSLHRAVDPRVDESTVYVMVVPLLDPKTGETLNMPLYNAVSLLITGFNRGFTQEGMTPLQFDDPFPLALSAEREALCSSAYSADGAVTIEAFKPADDLVVSAFLFGPADEHEARISQLEEILRSVRFEGTALEALVWSKVYELQAQQF